MLPDWAPNVHPLVVHFPLAVLLVAVLADAVSLLRPEQPWLQLSATSLYLLGAVGAIAAALTGMAAGESVLLPPDAIPVVTEHEEWGEWTAWFFGILAPVRLLASWAQLDRTRVVHLVLFVVALAGTLMLYETGEHGAQLVYQHGVGVKAQPHQDPGVQEEPGRLEEPSAPAVPLPPDQGPAFSSREDGAWTWNAGEGGTAVLRERFAWLAGAAPSASLVEDDSRIRVLRLEVPSHPVLFVAGPPVGGVVVRMRINVDLLQGTAMIVHQVRGADRYRFLALEGGRLRLGATQGGVTEVHAEGEYRGTGWLDVRLISDQGHSRGYVGEDLIAHGHGDEPRPGRVGLRLEGAGSVLVDRLEVGIVPQGSAGDD